MTIKIVNFDLKYIEKLIKLDLELVDKYKTKYSNEQWNEKNFSKELPKKFQFSKIIINKINNDEKLIGFVIVSDKNEFKDQEIHIHRFGIAEEYQFRGYGKKLLEELIHICLSENFNSITLNVNENNYSAINFYKKNHFKKVGKISDNLKMKRDLV